MATLASVTMLAAACGSPVRNQSGVARHPTSVVPSAAAESCFSNYTFELTTPSDLASSVREAERLLGSLPVPLKSLESGQVKSGLVPSSNGAAPAYVVESYGIGGHNGIIGVQIMYSLVPACSFERQVPLETFRLSQGSIAALPVEPLVDTRVFDGVRGIWMQGEIYIDMLVLWSTQDAPAQRERIIALKDWISKF
jgi:hypothetical protein